eukprot:gene29387-43133_t
MPSPSSAKGMGRKVPPPALFAAKRASTSPPGMDKRRKAEAGKADA